MSSFLLSSMVCIAAIVFAALVGLVLILIAPRSKPKEAQSKSSPGSAKTSGKSWKSWLPYIGIALLLAIWTIWAALFFLLVIWLLRQSPGSGADFKVSENEKKTAKRVYTWLFWSPLLTVPVFFLTLITADDSSTNRLVLAALMPLIFHIPLLAGL